MAAKRNLIAPKEVRYIKLGRNGQWEKECLRKGIIRFGFGSANAERYALCLAGKWKRLTRSFIASGKGQGTATRSTNETRKFFKDNGSILWVTFVGERFYWGFLKNTPPKPHADAGGVYRTVVGGWCCEDRRERHLPKTRFPAL